jgi:hypothetical protein
LWTGLLPEKIRIITQKDSTILEFPDRAAIVPRDPDLRKKVKAIADDPFTNGPECILLSLAIEFEKPIPYSGQVGLFNVDEKRLDLASTDRKKIARLLKGWK